MSEARRSTEGLETQDGAEENLFSTACPTHPREPGQELPYSRVGGGEDEHGTVGRHGFWAILPGVCLLFLLLLFLFLWQWVWVSIFVYCWNKNKHGFLHDYPQSSGLLVIPGANAKHRTLGKELPVHQVSLDPEGLVPVPTT